MNVLPAWIIPRDVARSCAAYEHDGELSVWLSAICRLTTRRLAVIERLSLRLIYDVPSKRLSDTVGSFLRMRDVQWWHLHAEWMRKGGALAGVPMDVRKAAFYDLWRSVKSGGSFPWELDPGKACNERFEMRGKRKRSGNGWRTYYAFGIARRTRQRMVDSALKAATCLQYRSQFMYWDGGRLEAICEIAKAMEADPSLTHWAKLDIANCFDNINLARAHEALPVTRKVIQHTISINPEEAYDRRDSEHIQYCRTQRVLDPSRDQASRDSLVFPSNHYNEGCSQVFAPRYPLQLPQGAACSPQVAYWLIERGLPPLDPARAFMYGDDLLILGQSDQEVRAEASYFRGLFRTHAAGPLQIGSVEIGTVAGGSDFLGIQLIRDGSRPLYDGQAANAVEISVADEPRQRFFEKLRERTSRGLASDDVSVSEACNYLRRFLAAAPSQDHASLMFGARAIARGYGLDPAIFEQSVVNE